MTAPAFPTETDARGPSIVPDRPLKALIWLYFLLLIFEGVFRKWVVPGLSTPLLIIRDPVILLIYLRALMIGSFPGNWLAAATWIVGLLCLSISSVVGEGGPFIALFGFRATFFHLPLIFLLPRTFTKENVLELGKWLVLLCIAMTPLMVLQFRAPPGDWLNVGAGGLRYAQLAGAMGRIRPPGFFTFVTGAAAFQAMATAFVLYGLLRRQAYPLWLILVGGFSLVISTAVSTSRTTLGSIGMVLLMLGVIAIYHREVLQGAMRMLLPVGVIFFTATQLDLFKEGRMVFEARLGNTGDLQSGAVGMAANWSERLLGDYAIAFSAASTAPAFGHGLGMGTNVGSQLTTGKLGFELAEGEWARIVLESGPFLGLATLMLRVAYVISVFAGARRSAIRGNYLPMLIFGGCWLIILSGQFSQPTLLGFAVLGGGLCLAAENDGEEDPDDAADDAQFSSEPATVRSRSIYAEHLHGSGQ